MNITTTNIVKRKEEAMIKFGKQMAKEEAQKTLINRNHCKNNTSFVAREARANKDDIVCDIIEGGCMNSKRPSSVYCQNCSDKHNK